MNAYLDEIGSPVGPVAFATNEEVALLGLTAPCSEVGPLRIRTGQCLLGRPALRVDRRYGVQQAEERGRMGQYHCKPL